jgi:predicted Zn-dependent protease
MRLPTLALACWLALGCGGPQLEHTPLDLSRLLPTALEADRAVKSEPRIAKVRVYADAAVRAGSRWREALADQLDYATQFLTPLVGVKLVVESIRDWDRAGDPHTALRALSALDAGDGVTWVVGYVAPLDVASTAMSELGDALPLDHHLVVHAWAQRHKQTVVLLHFLAVSLGAIAENDASWVMHAAYAPTQSTLSDRNRELIALTLDEWLGAGTRATAAAKLLGNIERTEWGGWEPRDHDAVVAVLRNIVDQGKAGKTAADVPPEIYDQYDRVRSLARKGEAALAMGELDSLIAAYPANASLFTLRCELALAPAGPTAAPTAAARAACTRVTELAPGDPSPHLALGEALVRAGDPVAARAELKVAEGKLPNLKAGADLGWQRLIAIYQGMGALTWTEAALAHADAKPDEPARAQLAQTRARYAIPAGATFVAAADEGALVAQTRAALDLVYASKFAEAERVLGAAETKWRRAPGLAAVRCDLALRQQQAGAAAAACARALAADPDASWARYLSGVIALRDPSAAATARGVAHLRRAIAVDPDLGQAWRALGKALARAHDQPGLDALRAAYQARFGTALPD